MRHRRLLTLAIALATGVFVSAPAIGTSADAARGVFKQTNLVSDIAGMAPVIDATC